MAPKNKYDTQVKPRLNEIKAWREDGLTVKEITARLGISESALYRYRENYPDFAEALNTVPDESLYEVAPSLLKKAHGYTERESVKTVIVEDGDGNITQKRTETIERTYPPDPRAAAAWMGILEYRRNRLKDTSQNSQINTPYEKAMRELFGFGEDE